MEGRLFELALAVLAVASAIVSGAVARWQEQKLRREDARRAWAVELRKLAKGVWHATISYQKRVAMGPDELARRGADPRAAYQAAWDLWSKEVSPIEADYFAYLDLVGFIDQDVRKRAAEAFTRFEDAGKGTLPKYMIDASEAYIFAVEEVIQRIDNELGLKTAMSTRTTAIARAAKRDQ